MLVKAGYPDAVICASGDLDEYSITSLKNQGAAISLWGVGTKMITGDRLPALGGVYKLAAVEENGKLIPKIKLSDNAVKITNPGFKNIYRIYDGQTGKAEADLIHLRGEKIDTDKPLTIFHPVDTWKKTTFENYKIRELSVPVILGGKTVYKFPTLKEVAKYAKSEMDSFWDEYLRIDNPHIFKVDLSKELYDLKTGMINEIRGKK